MGRHFFSPSSIIIRSFIRCKEIFLTFGVFFLPGIVAGTRPSGREFNDFAFLVRSLAITLPQIFLLLHLLRNTGGRKLSDYYIGPFLPRQGGQGAVAFLGLLPILFGLALIASLVPEDIIISALPSFRWSFDNYPLLPLVFLVCLVSAYREELYFRAYLIEEFRKLGAPLVSSAAVSTLLFASGHAYQGWSGFLVASILGTYLTAVFRLTGSVHPAAIAHGLYNTLVLLVSSFLFP